MKTPSMYPLIVSARKGLAPSIWTRTSGVCAAAQVAPKLKDLDYGRDLVTLHTIFSILVVEGWSLPVEISGYRSELLEVLNATVLRLIAIQARFNVALSCSASVVMPKPQTSIRRADLEEGKCESNRIAHDLDRLVTRICHKAAQRQEAPTFSAFRSRVGAVGTVMSVATFACVESVACFRDRVFHVADERLFQILGAAASSMNFCGASQASTLPAFMSEMRSQRILRS